MGRKIHESDSRVTIKRVIKVPPSWDEFDDRTHKSARETSPYKVGDEVQIGGGKTGLIVRVFSERLRRDDPWSDLLPKYRVRPRRKDGELSNSWNYIWPGQIDRAYKELSQ